MPSLRFSFRDNLSFVGRRKYRTRSVCQFARHISLHMSPFPFGFGPSKCPSASTDTSVRSKKKKKQKNSKKTEVRRRTERRRQQKRGGKFQRASIFVNSLLSGSFLIKLFSFSSDKDRRTDSRIRRKKHSAAPPGIEPRILRIPVARSNHWATKPQRELRVNSRFSPSCQFFFPLRGDPDCPSLPARSDQRKLAGFRSMGSIPGGAALCFFFVWSGCQFFYLCRSWKRRVWLASILFFTYSRINCRYGLDKANNNHFKNTTAVHFSAFVDLATEISAILPLWRLKLSVYFHLGEYYWEDFSSPVHLRKCQRSITENFLKGSSNQWWLLRAWSWTNR